jgi:hypothetical protein
MSQLKTSDVLGQRSTPAFKTDQLRMERRRMPRNIVESRVTAVFTGLEGRVGVMPLDITDSSATGLGARTTTMVEMGTKVMICPAGLPVPSRGCTVVRCIAGPNEGEYEIGLKFDSRRAA